MHFSCMTYPRNSKSTHLRPTHRDNSQLFKLELMQHIRPLPSRTRTEIHPHIQIFTANNKASSCFPFDPRYSYTFLVSSTARGLSTSCLDGGVHGLSPSSSTTPWMDWMICWHATKPEHRTWSTQTHKGPSFTSKNLIQARCDHQSVPSFNVPIFSSQGRTASKPLTAREDFK